MGRRRKYLDVFPPWTGQGHLLDVGCATDKFLRQMGALGWQLAGIEFDPDAAAKARTVTPDVFEGDPVDAPLAPGRLAACLGDRSGPAARTALALSRSRVGAGAMEIVLEGLRRA